MALRLEDAGVVTPRDFDAFYAVHAPRVRALLRRRVRRGQVDDLVQETFLRAYRNAGSFDRSRPAGPWLAAIANHVAIDFGRRRSTTQEEPTQVCDRRPAPGADPADVFQRSQHRDAILTAFASLPDRQRRVLVLRELQELHYEELAEHEGLSLDAVKSLLKRARESFRVAYTAAARQKGLLGVALVPVRTAARVLGRWRHMASTRVSVTAHRAAPAVTSLGELASISLIALGATALSVVGAPFHHRASPPSPPPAMAINASAAAGSLAAVGVVPPTAGQAPAVPAGGRAGGPMSGATAAKAAVGFDASGPVLYEHDHLKVTVLGTRIVEEGGATDTPCDSNAARQAACDILAVAPVPNDISVG
jgi:RNA polymerase sigma-70 factor (ECF subfamily)